ncbi:RagB/SusD family nutrient uptake outer membrane protein [Sphingobacterium sp. xlx-130]|uniref:RagB/SusD family nutrient uptake outer membrane protein n=1 Tax=Sphingobacterium sp. xlx-130 TaxID=2654323 RepID=UPI0013DC6E69|nr:RagB/SusD family nutrient uptake outer membrane protein [Sphingobacterium sp. xlx-130]
MKVLKHIMVVIFFSALTSCGKEFLDKKRDMALAIPSTTADYQALLDRMGIMNTQQSYALSLAGADEYKVSDQVWENGLTGTDVYLKNAYVWEKDVFEELESKDWNNAYQRILHANLILDINRVSPKAGEQNAWNNVKGSALFIRALNFYQLAQLFCKPYDAQTAKNDLGVPIRLDYDVTVKYNRGTVEELYQRMIEDLRTAAQLLPDRAEHIFRPSRIAANHLLAKIYLSMGKYELALEHVNTSLGIQNTLLDYNTLNLNTVNTFPAGDYAVSNPEVFYFSTSIVMEILSSSRVTNIPDEIYTMYELNDLRRGAYFTMQPDGRRTFKGSYQFNQSAMFTGFATDELWLMSAECKARLKNYQGAMEDVNHLLKYRYKTGTFEPFVVEGEDNILAFILKERRKQLFFRGVRWEDLRRLNKDPRFATTLVREVAGKRYELVPNSPRWVWPIPKNEIELNNLPQNER